jgi:diphthamide synthase (EF-2-diphthine--ammonia ligase)
VTDTLTRFVAATFRLRIERVAREVGTPECSLLVQSNPGATLRACLKKGATAIAAADSEASVQGVAPQGNRKKEELEGTAMTWESEPAADEESR